MPIPLLNSKVNQIVALRRLAMISRHWCIRLNPYNLRNLMPVSFTGAFHQPLVEAVQTSGCEALFSKD
ncbi:MAG: hypothetical protein V7K77_23180 [Nostoc sp.]|uniref:hypothetical protein n=1 Tax=Nostoc sp. TaxID=1180 RepID=UPI002FFC2973